MDFEKLAKEPIPGDNPAGIDIRYEPEFEEIQAEIDKLSSPTASGQVDWQKVVNLGGTILAEKSKDLKVAGYLAVGLIHTAKIEGLAQGLVMLRAMLEQYWDTLYPKKKRMRGRLGALTWWLEKAEAEIEKLTSTTIEAELKETLEENLKAIDELLAEKMPDPPLVRPLIRQVESLPIKQAAKAEPQAQPATAAAEKAAPRPKPRPSQPKPAEPETIATEKDAHKAVSSALQKIQQAAGFLLENNLADPAAFALRRIACWSRVVELPPAVEGRTQIPPPPPQVRQDLEQLQEDGKWEALVIGAEKRLSQFIFWFDLNRLATEALAALGDRCQDAAETICQQTAFLVYRLDGIQNLAFADGTAFCDEQTKAWLQSLNLGSGQAAAQPAPAMGQAGPEGQGEDQILAEARKLKKKRKLPQAIALLQDQMRQSFGLRKQFCWRLAIARLLLEAKKVDLARPQLEHILQTIERYGLESWEPALALEGLVTAMSGFRAAKDKALQERCNGLLVRIAAIDPAAAIRAG